MHPLCEWDPEKPKQRTCMKCTGLKEQCEWPEVVTSPRGGEKCKKKKIAAKVVDNNNNIVEVPGPSGKQSRFDPGLFLE